MGDKRKLQGEIERCLKKVSEGVETFEDIWQKVHNATNSNQKEKYEADLKKEIKKLQRLRDQIKSWAASNEIKDKRTLLENRRLIETQMERFKVVERETKTKAYSKEGLGLAAKVDPVQKEKDDVSMWMRGCIDKLTVQIDSFEMEVENITSSSKKRKIPTDRQERLDELAKWLENHRYHIRQLETLMRMLDNSTIEVDQIKKVQDDLEYYIDYSQDPDFEENEFMYDELELDDEAGLLATSPEEENHLNSDTPLSSSPIVSSSLPSSSNHSKDKVEDDKKSRTKSVDDTSLSSSSSPRKGSAKSTSSLSSLNSIPITTTSSTQQSRPTITRVSSSPGTSTTNSSASSFSGLQAPIKNSLSKANSVPSATTPHAIAQPPPGPAYAVAAGGQTHNSQGSNAANRVTSQQPTAVSSHMMSNSMSLSSSTMVQSSSNPQHNNTPRQDMNGPHQGYSIELLTSSVANLSTNSTLSSSSSHIPHMAHSTVPSSSSATSSSSMPFMASSMVMPTSSTVETNAVVTALSTSAAMLTKSSDAMVNGPLSPENKEDDSSSMSTLKTMAQKVVMSSGLENFQSDLITENMVYNSTSRSESQGQSTTPANSTPQYQETTIPPLLGVAPLGPVTLSKEQRLQQSVMESCFHHLPLPSDSERLRNYLPRNPCPTPTYHCQVMPHRMGTLEFFMRLSTETLFFIFYYQEGTKAQYLAAKALKRQSWRFHTKYMMWFQRHEEPKTITEEYEQGTYIYFDYEKWGQRKKEGFTFEYRYLEDREL
ncbi:CCR4-NOT transcription complex subunit 3-like isoform X2 [Lytechinus pictus]|uniref:CCR4-NOT transcription complex subunit 3-like isoform X2 n=2 Tax=Lytechinus pictus TaxID=7653 RepID=UPI0030B9E849